MSLNGDGFVMRNGRSTSQVSIYNYPEHLNPFYEDDQHKRLRFWQINKKGSDGEGRRNSFSLSGLKDVWAFKSFRSKKKSSTLGVNKTSESPPTLRRDMQYGSTQMDNAFNSYDRRTRYSSNNASPANNNFQRNVVYRSSLQNMNSTQDSSSGFGLNRNDQYRRTIQTAGAGTAAQQPHSQQTLSTLPQSRRYVYGGSVTPQPLRSSEYGRGGDSREVLTRGSSQLSVASTNPFESDYEEDNEDILVKSNNKHLITSTPVSKRTTPHKKRRAPAPPESVHKANGNEISTEHSTESSQQNSHHRLHIDEEVKSREIANLTAEIESFVKTTNDEPPEGQQLHSKQETKQKLESSKQNGAVRKETKTTTTEAVEILATSAEITATAVKTTPTPVKRTPAPVKTTPSISSEMKTNTNTAHIVEESPHHPKELNSLSPNREAPIGSVECIHIHVDSPRATPERNEPSRVTSFRVQEQHQPETENITGKTSFTLASPPPTSPTASRRGEIEIRTITDKPLATKRTTITTTTTTKTTQQQQLGALSDENNDLKITETSTNTSNSTPITREENNSTNFRPPIAAKPNVEVTRTRISTLAEIHKPTKGILKHSVCESESYTEPAPINKLEIKETLGSTTSDVTKKDATDAQVLSSTITIHERTTPPPTPRVTGLKIVELVEVETPKQPLETSANFAKINATLPTQPIRPPRSILQASTDEFEALYRSKPTTHMEWKKSTLAPLETNVPPEKRKSVKDIIESINRSQRLLNAAAHKDQAASLHIMRDAPASDNECGGRDDGANAASFSSLTTTPQMQRKSSELNNNFNTAHLDENHREVHRFYKEMLDLRTAGANGNGTMSDAVEGEEHDATKINNNINDAQQKLDNSEVFRKCKVTKEVYQACRESSPTASNLDWNPVPKPKRTKHMPEI